MCAFLRVFNWATIAAAFWLCLAWVVSDLLPKLPVMSALDWVEEVAYMVRQNLLTAIVVLAAIAAGHAWLPLRSGKAPHPLAMLGTLVAACLVGAGLRAVVAGNGFTSTAELLVWLILVVVLWTTIGWCAAQVFWYRWRETVMRDRLREHASAEAALAAGALEARVAALQAQIEPHFLFNTLANVRRLYEVDVGQGKRMLGSLLDYLRAALPAMRRAETPLADELDLVRAYLTVLGHRMGDRLRFEVAYDPALGRTTIPPLIVPTLVENAIKHGLAPLPEGGTIRVEARVDPTSRGDTLVIAVRDDGAGFSASCGSGVGLANTRARLAAQFGAAARLELRENRPRGVVAEIHLPAA